MANISVRNLDAKIYTQLQLRASKHGISMEEEVRQIISQAVSTPERISEVFQQYFGKKNGIDLAPMDFSE